MIDLGKYAVTVLSAYAGTFALIGALVALTLAQGRKVRRDLAEAEARVQRDQA